MIKEFSCTPDKENLRLSHRIEILISEAQDRNSYLTYVISHLGRINKAFTQLQFAVVVLEVT